MTFLSPSYLLGAAGVLVPVLIHLFGRRRPRRLQFPSLRLLRAAQQQRRSPMRLRRLLALLMRVAAIVLLSLALAGPVTDSLLLGWLVPDQALHALVLDTSASMSCRSRRGGISFLDRGRKAAEQIAAAMPAGATVLPAGAASRLQLLTEQPVLPAEARGLMGRLAPGEERGRLTGCIVEALALLREGGRAPGTVYLITDLQGTSLAPLPRQLSGQAGRVVVVDVGEDVAGSAGVTELAMAEPPALRGRPLRLRARVQAWGRPAGSPMPLALSAPPLPSVGRGVSPRPGPAEAGSLAEFEITPVEGGLLAGRVELPADAFALDDRRLFAEYVLESVRVLIVGEEADSRYLRAALDPFPEGDERSVVRVQRMAAEALAEAELRSFDVVVLADVPRLESAARENLAQRVARGGGALVFVGPAVEAAAYNDSILGSLALGGVSLGAPVRFADGLALTELETSRPPLAAFASPRAGDLMTPRFVSARELGLADDARVTELARFEDGTPALLERAHGRGRVILFNTDAGARWSDLVRRPVYVPLVHRLIYHLARGGRPQTDAAGPGQTVAGVMPARVQAAEVKRVGGGPVPISRRGTAWSFVPEQTGAYVVAAGGEEMAAFAVNLDAAESDPTRLTVAELRRRLAPLDVTVVRGAGLGEFLQGRAPTRAEVSAFLALLALLLLVVESVYSLEPPRTTADSY